MKKFLSLVLALVMTMSLVTISAGAKDFTDSSSIKYGEAVDVMSGVGVIDGYTTGDFKPTDTLTRGAAAKIICNMILGPTTAGALSADTAPFKDVPANHVFAGYIAYCAQQGIINGYNDGSFKPAGTVTGYQFLKMLLGALGYDGSIEGFTGGNWTVNVAKLASSLGLMKGNDNFVGTNAMTREEACLYAFNTMQTTMVEYENNFVIVGSDGKVTQGVSSAKEVANNTTSANTIKKDGKMQFAERYFKDLKLTAGTDAFERPANIWNYKTTNIGTYPKAADASYTEEVKTGTIYNDLGLSNGIDASKVSVYVDGTAGTAKNIVKAGTDKFGGNGALTQVYYDTDAGTVIITVINTYVGTVDAKYNATSSRDAYITIGAKTGNGGNYETTNFAVDDVVLYTYSNRAGDVGVQSVKSAETVTGTLTGYTEQSSVTVNGTSYKVNSVYKASATNTNLGSFKTYEVTVVLDEYGYAAYVDTANATGNYAVILKIKAGDSWSNPKAQLLLADGTVKEVTLANSMNSNITATTASFTYPALGDNKDKFNIGDIVTYAVSSKDEYTLTLRADVDTNNVKGSGSAATTIISKGNSSLGGLNGNKLTNGSSNGTWANTASKVANSKTLFLVASGSADSPVYNVYTGIKNVPTIKTATTTTATPVTVYCKTSDGDATATVVFVDTTNNGTVESNTKDVIFVNQNGTPNATYDSNLGYSYYVYSAIVNGEVVSDFKSTVQVSSRALYTGVSYNSDGIASALTGQLNTDGTSANLVASNGGYANGVTKAENEVIGLGNQTYGYSNDCKVFVVNENGEISGSSIAAIGTDSTVRAYAKITDGEITTLVIVQSAGTPGGTGGGSYAISNASLGKTSSNFALTFTTATALQTSDKIDVTITKVNQNEGNALVATKTGISASAGATQTNLDTTIAVPASGNYSAEITVKDSTGKILATASIPTTYIAIP